MFLNSSTDLGVLPLFGYYEESCYEFLCASFYVGKSLLDIYLRDGNAESYGNSEKMPGYFLK